MFNPFPLLKPRKYTCARVADSKLNPAMRISSCGGQMGWWVMTPTSLLVDTGINTVGKSVEW